MTSKNKITGYRNQYLEVRPKICEIFCNFFGIPRRYCDSKLLQLLSVWRLNSMGGWTLISLKSTPKFCTYGSFQNPHLNIFACPPDPSQNPSDKIPDPASPSGFSYGRVGSNKPIFTDLKILLAPSALLYQGKHVKRLDDSVAKIKRAGDGASRNYRPQYFLFPPIRLKTLS